MKNVFPLGTPFMNPDFKTDKFDFFTLPFSGPFSISINVGITIGFRGSLIL